jgi:hypothetical protein
VAKIRKAEEELLKAQQLNRQPKDIPDEEAVSKDEIDEVELPAFIKGEEEGRLDNEGILGSLG